MPIPFRCPHCGLQTQVDQRYAGQTGPCAGCGQAISIPVVASRQASMSAPATQPQGKSSVLLVATIIGVLLLGALAVIGILVALLLPAIGSAREAARRAACANQMRQIATAMLQYEAEHGSLPPAYTVDANGRPQHSWRVLLLPYLGPDAQSINSRYDYDAAWDSPQNQMLAKEIPQVYVCPSDPAAPTGDTSYCVLSGPDYVFHADKTTKLADLAAGSGMQTLLLVETHGAGINWLQPRDMTEPELMLGLNSGMQGGCASEHPGGINGAFADGRVTFLSDSTSPEELSEMAKVRASTSSPAEIEEPAEVLGPVVPPTGTEPPKAPDLPENLQLEINP